MTYLWIILGLILSMQVYLDIAKRFNIYDRPNERSSHSKITIRGGGIIYLVATLFLLIIHPEFWMLVSALFIVGVISFIDDRITLSSKIRLIVQFASTTIIMYYLQAFSQWRLDFIVLVYLIFVGVINAFNFMDGINGITGINSLMILGGLLYVNCYTKTFVEVDLIYIPMISTIIFLFYNFRKTAICFAGDVGSITIGLWITFLLMKVVLDTGNISYILFLAVYGVDTLLTIAHRLVLGQNILTAHRLHAYQVLANDLKVPHLLVSIWYGLTQLVIILLVVFSNLSTIMLMLITLVPLIAIYLILKRPSFCLLR